jgi:2-polyprenyl-6-methoxyphenol hydroxylase-like FAD-dependent oxidoreductase
MLTDLLKVPHDEVLEVAAQIGSQTLALADFRRLPTRCHFLALMPQWDFLNFLVDRARAYPTFRLEMEAEVTGLVTSGDRVVGVEAKTPRGPLTVHAGLTVGADGRRSVVRREAGLKVLDQGAPMDVMWMRVAREPSDPAQTFGHVEPGRMLVMLNRGDYWQCAYLIRKGEADAIRAKGLGAFRASLVAMTPYLEGRVDALESWDDVSLLSVRVDRLEKWSRPGLLCIGDAAHAMSPIGGVGINLAIQDAVATANLLASPLRRGIPTDREVERVQARREFPTRATQAVQVAFQSRVIDRVLRSKKPLAPPLALLLASKVKSLRTLPALVVGVGFRPEHVRSPSGA